MILQGFFFGRGLGGRDVGELQNVLDQLACSIVVNP